MQLTMTMDEQGYNFFLDGELYESRQFSGKAHIRAWIKQQLGVTLTHACDIYDELEGGGSYPI